MIFIRFCKADELNGQALLIHHTNPCKNYNFQNDGTSRYFGLWLWRWVYLLNLVCSFQCVFIYVFHQTLAEQLYRDKVLLIALSINQRLAIRDERWGGQGVSLNQYVTCSTAAMVPRFRKRLTTNYWRKWPHCSSVHQRAWHGGLVSRGQAGNDVTLVTDAVK